jgi:hypothetical protein
MTQHTPGPWAVTDRDWAKGYRIQATVGSVKTGEDIAQITNVPDARLIAAAPEMLAVIGEILDGLNDLGERAYRVAEALNPELEKARALLAKVEGAR